MLFIRVQKKTTNKKAGGKDNDVETSKKNDLNTGKRRIRKAAKLLTC